MIASLLEALREKDPGAYGAWKVMHEVYSIREGCAMSDVWLQAVLQEACQARGWFGAVYFGKKDGDLAKVFGHSHCAIISWKDGELYRHIKQFGDSPAEALLRCYLVAI